MPPPSAQPDYQPLQVPYEKRVLSNSSTVMANSDRHIDFEPRVPTKRSHPVENHSENDEENNEEGDSEPLAKNSRRLPLDAQSLNAFPNHPPNRDAIDSISSPRTMHNAVPASLETRVTEPARRGQTKFYTASLSSDDNGDASGVVDGASSAVRNSSSPLTTNPSEVLSRDPTLRLSHDDPRRSEYSSSSRPDSEQEIRHEIEINSVNPVVRYNWPENQRKCPRCKNLRSFTWFANSYLKRPGPEASCIDCKGPDTVKARLRNHPALNFNVETDKYIGDWHEWRLKTYPHIQMPEGEAAELCQRFKEWYQRKISAEQSERRPVRSHPQRPSVTASVASQGSKACPKCHDNHPKFWFINTANRQLAANCILCRVKESCLRKFDKGQTKTQSDARVKQLLDQWHNLWEESVLKETRIVVDEELAHLLRSTTFEAVKKRDLSGSAMPQNNNPTTHRNTEQLVSERNVTRSRSSANVQQTLRNEDARTRETANRLGHAPQNARTHDSHAVGDAPRASEEDMHRVVRRCFRARDVLPTQMSDRVGARLSIAMHELTTLDRSLSSLAEEWGFQFDG